MEKRRRYQNFGPFLNPRRGFLSEVILPPEGRDMNSGFLGSWSDSCLGPGLRRVLHQLWDRRSRTFREGHDCRGRHDYFSDILCTVSGLDYEFNKLEHFLSTRKRISVANIRDRTPSTISTNDMTYLDLAAKSLLELILCLKHELKLQVNVGRVNSFSTMFKTNKLISVIENKLSDLLEKIDDFKSDSDMKFCCKRRSDHITNVSKPMRNRLNCPLDNNCGKDRYLKNMCLDYQPGNEDPLPFNRSCRAHDKGLTNQSMRASHPYQLPKFYKDQKTQNYNLAGSKTIKLPSNVDQWFKSGSLKSKNSKDLHNTFMGAYGRLNKRMINKKHQKGKKDKKQKSCCSIPNTKNDLNNLARYEMNSMVNASSKTAAEPQHNKFRRKRAGKDGSGISDLSIHNPSLFNNKRRFRRETYTKRKSNEKRSHNQTSPASSQTNMWPKQVSFCSKTSDRTSSVIDDNVSNSLVFWATDFQNTQRKSKQNFNHSSNKRLDKFRKDYSYTNRLQRNPEGQKGPKNNNIKLQRRSDSFSSQEKESIKSDYKYTNPNIRNKSHFTNYKGPCKNQSYFQVNKPNEPPNRTINTSKLKTRKKENNNNTINKPKPFHSGVYPSKPHHGYRNHRARPNTSKVGNFLKKVRNNLSKIRLFSSKPTKHISESQSSESSVSYSTELPRKGYKISPIRREVGYTKLRNQSRHRIRPRTNEKKGKSIVIESVEYDVSSSSSNLTQFTYTDDDSISGFAESDNVGNNYPYYFERIPSSYEYVSDCNTNTVPDNEPQIDVTNDQQPCDVCPFQRGIRANHLPIDDGHELADEYEIIFEKVEPKIERNRPKRVVCKKPSEDFISTISTVSSPSSDSLSSSLHEYEIIHQPPKRVRKSRFRTVTITKKSSFVPEYKIIDLTPNPVRRNITKKRRSFIPEYKTIHQSRNMLRRNRFINLTTIKKRSSPAEVDVVRRLKHKRHRKYIRVGSEKFQESSEKVVDHDYQLASKTMDPLPTIKNVISRGTSTEAVEPAEEIFTFHPPAKDTYSRGTGTEVLPLYTKRTSTSDLIRLIQAIGTNTERVITRDKGIDPIPLKQKTLPVVTDVRSKFTNTDRINVRNAGTDTIPESAKPPVVNTATDPVFYLDQKDQTTNTLPAQKIHVTHMGTDPRPTVKIQQATKATDPLYHLGQQVKFTNTEPVITIHAHTETPKQPANISIGTTTTPLTVQDQKTSYDKVKTSSRGNHPITVKMADKGFQYDTVQHKPSVKTAFTETFTQLGVGKITQTSFKEKPTIKPSVYQVQTQTETVQKPPPPILRPRPPIIPDEIAVVEPEEPEPDPSISSPSELSMCLVFEKCQDEIYKRRTCNPGGSSDCEHGQRLLVCNNVRSRQMLVNSLSDCNVSSIPHQKDKSSHSDLELIFTRIDDPQTSNFTLEDGLQTDGKVQSSHQTKNPKQREECGAMSQTNQIHKQNHTDTNNLFTDTDEKSKSTIEAGVWESSYTTFTSCDWTNIVKQMKLDN